MTSFIQAGMPALRTPSLVQLDERARDIFRMVVETYLETGEPVGSRTLSQTGIALSPASIRNTMQDLTLAGLLGAPHTSAGRIPTHAGLRLFVDGLLEIGDVGTEERREIDARLAGLNEFLGVEPNPIPVKAILARQGIGHGLRLPLLPLSQAHAAAADAMTALCEQIESELK